MAKVIGTRTSASRFDGLLEDETRRFIWRVLQTPERFVDHIRTYVLSNGHDFWISSLTDMNKVRLVLSF
jgi:hypothetical protein